MYDTDRIDSQNSANTRQGGVSPFVPDYEDYINGYPGRGSLKIQISAAYEAFPIKGVEVDVAVVHNGVRYIIEDRTLLVRMQELVDQAEEVVFGEEIEKVDKAYEELQDVLNQFLSTLKLLNFIPNTTDFDVTSFNSSNNCGYKEDGGIMQLDNFRSGGYIIYKVYNKQDAE